MFFNLGMEENLVNRYFERMTLIGNVKDNICHLEEKHHRDMSHIINSFYYFAAKQPYVIDVPFYCFLPDAEPQQ